MVLRVPDPVLPAVWAAAQEQPPERLVGWEVVLGVALVLHLV